MFVLFIFYFAKVAQINRFLITPGEQSPLEILLKEFNTDIQRKQSFCLILTTNYKLSLRAVNPFAPLLYSVR